MQHSGIVGVNAYRGDSGFAYKPSGVFWWALALITEAVTMYSKVYTIGGN
jgi:hypothetical protein